MQDEPTCRTELTRTRCITADSPLIEPEDEEPAPLCPPVPLVEEPLPLWPDIPLEPLLDPDLLDGPLIGSTRPRTSTRCPTYFFSSALRPISSKLMFVSAPDDMLDPLPDMPDWLPELEPLPD